MPEQELGTTNGSVQLESSSNEQMICAIATDEVGNQATTCSDKYLVDGTEPTLVDMTLTPFDDTMSVLTNASDNESGVVKYYYSKNSGTDYIDAENNNYTFMDLDEADYLVTVYVEDAAGNISEILAKSTTIRHAGFCIHNGITDLGDCIIATEAGNETNIELAKLTIEAKGTPNFNTTSPSIVYGEVISSNTSTLSSNYSTYYIGTGYTFNSKTGMYNLTGTNGLEDPTTKDYNSGNYYICGSNLQSISSCSTIYRITNLTTSANQTSGQITYTFTKYNLTQRALSYDTSEVGLYAGVDDDGTTYYYRGSVSGNYVKLGDKYFRVIRVNGDGTVRLIYDGTEGHTNGEASSDRQVGTSAFNSYINDNTYVGYMYGDVSKFEETDSGDLIFNHIGLSNSAKYYFGTSYTLDRNTRSFKLAGDLHSGTISPAEVGYYTCFSTSETASCQRLFYTIKYNTTTSMTVKGKAYGTTSLENANEKVNNSNIKTYLENWYNNNLSEYNDIISSDIIFCNNKTISNVMSGTYYNTGYGITPTIYGYERFYNWASQGKLEPTLLCPDEDSYTQTGVKGNGLLDNPVGLITADEVNMAGGMTSMVNSLYYLYTGTNYWTMSPSYFDGWFYASGMVVYSTGALNSGSTWNGYGVRPVINLDPDKLTFDGSGTMEDPWVVEAK